MSAVPCVVVSFSCGTGAHLGCDEPHFCVAEYSVAGEGINCIVCSCENTAVDVSDNGHLPVFLGVSEVLESHGLCAGLSTVGIGITCLKSPYTYGHGNESCLTCCLNVTGLGNGNGSYVVSFVNCVGSLKAVGNGHVIELPLAVVVKVNVNLNRFNCCNVGSNEIHPVDGAELDAVLRRIVSYELNRAVGVSRVNGNVTDSGCIVTHLVLCGELDLVLSVVKTLNVNCNNAVCVCTVNLNTVNVSLNTVSIDAGSVCISCIVCYLNCERNVACSNGLVVKVSCIGHTCHCVGDVTEYGSLSVVYCRGVVYSKIIKVELILRGDITGTITRVIVCCTVTVGHIELYNIRICFPTYCFVSGNVDPEVVPAGFNESGGITCTTDRCIHSVCCKALGEYRLSICIKGYRKYSKTSPKSIEFIVNIYPYTDLLCILEHSGLGRIHRGLHITGLKGVGVIYNTAECIVTAVNLTVLCGNNLLRGFGPCIVVLSSGRFIEDYCTVTVLEVINNLRALAESDLGGSNESCVMNESCCDIGACYSYVFSTRDEIEAVKSTCCCVGKNEVKVGCLDGNVLNTVGSCHTENNGLAVRNNHLGVVEFNYIGNYNVKSNAACCLAVVHSGDGSLACIACGEYAVSISTVVGNVGNVSGDFCSMTCGGNTAYVNLNGGTGSHIIVLGSKCYTVKRCGSNCCGNDDKAVGDRTLGTVGGGVGDNEVILTLGLTSVSTGSAAVEVKCLNASEVNHYLSLLKKGKTDGLGSLVTVCHHKDNVTVSGDTDGLTGVLLGIALGPVAILVYRTVFYDVVVTADSFLDLTLVG